MLDGYVEFPEGVSVYTRSATCVASSERCVVINTPETRVSGLSDLACDNMASDELVKLNATRMAQAFYLGPIRFMMESTLISLIRL